MLLLGILAALLIFAAIVVYGSFSWGFVLFKFWYWFLLPVFVGLPQIDYLSAVGIMLFIGLFKHHATKVSIKDEFLKEEEKLNIRIVNFLSPWIVLAVGFFINLIIN